MDDILAHDTVHSSYEKLNHVQRLIREASNFSAVHSGLSPAFIPQPPDSRKPLGDVISKTSRHRTGRWRSRPSGDCRATSTLLRQISQISSFVECRSFEEQFRSLLIRNEQRARNALQCEAMHTEIAIASTEILFFEEDYKRQQIVKLFEYERLVGTSQLNGSSICAAALQLREKVLREKIILTQFSTQKSMFDCENWKCLFFLTELKEKKEPAERVFIESIYELSFSELSTRQTLEYRLMEKHQRNYLMINTLCTASLCRYYAEGDSLRWLETCETTQREMFECVEAKAWEDRLLTLFIMLRHAVTQDVSAHESKARYALENEEEIELHKVILRPHKIRMQEYLSMIAREVIEANEMKLRRLVQDAESAEWINDIWHPSERGWCTLYTKEQAIENFSVEGRMGMISQKWIITQELFERRDIVCEYRKSYQMIFYKKLTEERAIQHQDYLREEFLHYYISGRLALQKQEDKQRIIIAQKHAIEEPPIRLKQGIYEVEIAEKAERHSLENAEFQSFFFEPLPREGKTRNNLLSLKTKNMLSYAGQSIATVWYLLCLQGREEAVRRLLENCEISNRSVLLGMFNVCIDDLVAIVKEETYARNLLNEWQLQEHFKLKLTEKLCFCSFSSETFFSLSLKLNEIEFKYREDLENIEKLAFLADVLHISVRNAESASRATIEIVENAIRFGNLYPHFLFVTESVKRDHFLLTAESTRKKIEQEFWMLSETTCRCAVFNEEESAFNYLLFISNQKCLVPLPPQNNFYVSKGLFFLSQLTRLEAIEVIHRERDIEIPEVCERKCIYCLYIEAEVREVIWREENLLFTIIHDEFINLSICAQRVCEEGVPKITPLLYVSNTGVIYPRRPHPELPQLSSDEEREALFRFLEEWDPKQREAFLVRLLIAQGSLLRSMYAERLLIAENEFLEYQSIVQASRASFFPLYTTEVEKQHWGELEEF